MNIQYFKSAWGDIKNSPGWFGKICLLALLNLVPVFGQIVTFAYLYGWAREIAWGTHEPMPQKIFANDDGKFWRRGWFVLVLMFVFMLIPNICYQVGSYWQMLGMVGSITNARGANQALGMAGSLCSLVGSLGMIVLTVFAWIGSMRVSIYDRLSAGFQFGKMWKMVRFDTKGILKVFGMNILVSLIFGILLSIVVGVLTAIVMFVGVTGLMQAGYSPQSIQYMISSQTAAMLLQLVSSSGIVGALIILAGMFLILVSAAFTQTLTVRAMGYWTMQFDVPRWRGQDEPLPFEVAGVSQPEPYPQPPAYATPPAQQAQPPAYATPPTQQVQPPAYATPPAQQAQPAPQQQAQPAPQPYGQPAQEVSQPRDYDPKISSDPADAAND